VTQTPADTIISFLSYSSNATEGLTPLRNLPDRKWRRILTWLDEAGLALYFLDKVIQTDSTRQIPSWVISRLERCLLANQARVSELSAQFARLNQSFAAANVSFAVVKGFSMVPQYCPDASLRHQGDLDYLIDEASIGAAERIVLEAGYNLKPRTSSQEFIFIKPGNGPPSQSQDQYSPLSPHAVELHLNMWDSDQHPLPEIPHLFSPARAQSHSWNELSFPALNDPDAFLLQVLHACQHLFTYWIRMSSLYEIGFFLNHRSSDTLLWNQVKQRVGENRIVREFVVVVSQLSAKLFAAPLPDLIQDWARETRPAVRTWIDHYSRECALCDVPAYEFRFLPKAKLVLFLQQQYVDECRDKQVLRTRLLKSTRVARMVESVKAQPSLLLNRFWWKRQLVIRRTLFHAMAGLRYLLEIPRWQWLNRTKTSPLGSI